MKSNQPSPRSPRCRLLDPLPSYSSEHFSVLTSCKSAKFRLKPSLSLKRLNEKSYFPDWLLNRQDFLNSLTAEDQSLNPDQICTKPNSQRDAMERSALKQWTEDCEFFKHLTDHSANEVRKKLSTVFFKKGESLIKEGDESLCMFIICTGAAEIFKNGVSLSETISAKNTVGESGIKNNVKRSATVVAKTDISALMLKVQDYDEIVRRQKYREKFEMVDYLKGIKFFAGFFGSKLENIAYNLFTMQYFNGQVIYASDEEPVNFYILKEGSVKFERTVVINLKSRIPGSPKRFVRKRVYTKVVRECSAGEFFGEDEVISGCPRKTTAICSSDKTIIWILKKKEFLQVFNEKDLVLMKQQAMNRPDTKELSVKLKNEFVDEIKRVGALMDATHLSPVPAGRVEMGRRHRILNGIINRHHCVINNHLLSDRAYVE